MSMGLKVGLVLTIMAWIGLIASVVHGKYVTEKIGAGTYRKGPFEAGEEDRDG